MIVFGEKDLDATLTLLRFEEWLIDYCCMKKP